MRFLRRLGGSSDPEDARERMVREQLVARGIRDPLTLAAMAAVPREAFVPDDAQASAYDDRALAIDNGQTISQPYMVAAMTAALDLGRSTGSAAQRPVLDVGTGSGYQAAVLAHTGARVISVERDPQLATSAYERLARLGYPVEVVIGDGSLGNLDHAPYRGIVVAAGVPTVPEPLVDQLADGARLVIPIGPREGQHLTIVERRRTGSTTRTADPCVFVPLVGEYGYHI